MTNNKRPINWISKHPIIVILIWAILVRIVVFYLYGIVTIYPDSHGYYALANYISHFTIQGYDGGRSPGYPLLISLLSGNIYWLILLQTIIGICTLVIFYKLLLSLLNKPKIALVTTLLLAIYLPSVFFEFAILSESLTLLFIILLFYLLAKVFKSNNHRTFYFVLITLISTYLVLIKPFYVCIGAFLFFIFIFNNFSVKNVIIKYSWLLLLPVLAFLGWSQVNKMNTGYFVSTSYYGYNMAQNCVRFAEKTTPEYQQIGDIYAKYRERAAARPHNPIISMSIWHANKELMEVTGVKTMNEMSAILFDYATTTIRMNKVDYIKQVFISGSDFWKVTDIYWTPEKMIYPAFEKPLILVYYGEKIVMQLFKVVFFIFIFYNIFMLWKKRKITMPLIISLLVLMVAILQAFTTYGTNSRYSFPFEYLIVMSVLLNINDILTQRKLRSNTKNTT